MNKNFLVMVPILILKVYGKQGNSSRQPLIDGDDAAGRHRFGDPGVAADDTAVPNYGVSTQNGGAGIDGNVVFYSWMSLVVPLSLVDAECAQGYTLVELYLVADKGGLPNDNTSSVVYEKGFADGGTWVDVYARASMDIFAHNAGDDGNAIYMELVGDAIHGNSLDSGIGQDDFFHGACRRVSTECRLYVQAHFAANLWNLLHQGDGGLFCQLGAGRLLQAPLPAKVEGGLFYFPGKGNDNLVDFGSRYVAQVVVVQLLHSPESGKNQAENFQQHIDNVLAVGEILCVTQVDATVLLVGGEDAGNKVVCSHSLPLNITFFWGLDNEKDSSMLWG